MTNKQKQQFIKKHFSKECRIFLSDVRETKYFKDLEARNNKKSQGASMGRKKHICYICFEKFATKEELEEHKIIHTGEENNDTSSDDNNEREENPSTSSSKHDEQVNTTAEMNESVVESTSENPVVETNYKCLKCNMYFNNQIDVKAHAHTQYFCKYYCKPCNRQFNTKGGFIVHVLQHDMTNFSKFSYRCNKCPFSFDDCYKLKRHYVTVHNVSNSPAKYAENIVKSRENPNVNVDKPKEILTENTLPFAPIPTQDLNPLERIIEESANPITGSIPIFDCDVCYDVFASEKALNRHKALHKELEKKSEAASAILIEDDDMQVFQEDDTSDKHEMISSFATTSPMVNYAPIPPTSKLTPSENIDLLRKCSIQIGDNPPQPIVNITSKSSDKTQITSEITQMLAGRKPWPKMEIPKLVPVSQSRLIRKPSHPALNKPMPSTPSTRLPSVLPARTSSLQAASINSPSSKQSDVSLPSGSPIYVVCPPNSGQSFEGSTSVPGTASSGPPFMMINSTSTITTPSANFVIKNQSETNTGTIMPNLGQNQFIINQQINTGGVVINPQPNNVPGSSFVITPNVEGHPTSVQKAPVLQAISGLPGAEGQVYYILMPSPPVNQGDAVKQNIELSSAKPTLQQQTVMSTVTSNIKQEGVHIHHKMTEESLKKISRPNPNYDNLINPSLLKNKKKEETHENASLLLKTQNIDVSKGDLNSSSQGKPPDMENKETDQKIIMPIITSISTVTEEKNKTDKFRKDPITKYESEFAKFLEQSDDCLVKLGRPRIVTKITPNFVVAPKVGQLCESTSALSKTSSNDEVILLDDNSSSNEDSTENISKSPRTSTVTSASKGEVTEQPKPKIFVKKLSDLLSKPQAEITSSVNSPPLSYAPETSQGNIKQAITVFRHCCLRCNSQLKDWSDLRAHLKNLHQMFACKFGGCSVFDSFEEYDQHMQKIHRCSKCGHDFNGLRNHQRNCFKRQTFDVHSIDKPPDAQSTQSFDINVAQPSYSQQNIHEHEIS